MVAYGPIWLSMTYHDLVSVSVQPYMAQYGPAWPDIVQYDPL